MHGKSFQAAGDAIIRGHAYRVRFSNASTNDVRYIVQDKRKEYYNFFLGNDRAKSAGKVAAYETIVRHNVYYIKYQIGDRELTRKGDITLIR